MVVVFQCHSWKNESSITMLVCWSHVLRTLVRICMYIDNICHFFQAAV